MKIGSNLLKKSTPLLLLISLVPLNSSAESFKFDYNLPSVETGQVFTPTALLDRSYCCEITNSSEVVFGNVDFAFSPTTSSNQTSAYPTTASRKCFFSPYTAAGFERGFQRMILESRNSQEGLIGEDVKISCEETTLFGGYNTFAAQFIFLEVISSGGNYSADPVKVELLASNSTLAGRGRINVPISVGFFPSRYDVNIHELVGANSYGTLSLMHTASAGTIRARIIYYNQDPTTGALVPVRNEELKTK